MKPEYKWEAQLSEFKIKHPRKIDHNGIRDILNRIKGQIKKEIDSDTKEDLANAGILISKILLR
jgi:hypothetical protein